MTTSIEREALVRSLAGVVGRTRAIQMELEAYRAEIHLAVLGEPHTRGLLAAFAEVVGDQGQAGALRRLDAAASLVLRALVAEGPDSPPRGSGTMRIPRPRALSDGSSDERGSDDD